MDTDFLAYVCGVVRFAFAAGVVVCAALLDGRQGIKDTLAGGIGWMWFYVIGFSAVLICVRYLAG
ncbi:hypothetical protein ACFX5Q_34120 [Mesorhizobium sp. IMUNJ 23033]|uniref:hypothetical protein n=1 Tax=Mesorhizobium sp. IMUNJ 23033 TaxID=3378039 RepID=UPI0038511BF2